MGIMETKTIQVRNDPREINAANEAFGRWGWSVLNVQITHTQNTKEYQEWYQYGSNSVTVETTTINYATITYQRDKGMKCYDRILELEQEYDIAALRVRGRFAARCEELEGKKQSLPKVYRISGTVILLTMMFGVFTFAVLYILLIKKLGINSVMEALFTIGSIGGFCYCLSYCLKSMSPQNREMITQHSKDLEIIDREMNDLKNQENELIRSEEARIINEAAALLSAE